MLRVYDGGVDTGFYGSHGDGWAKVRDCDPWGHLMVDMGHLMDLCSMTYSIVRDDDFARGMLCRDHVSGDFADGVLYALFYIGVRHDGDDAWVDPSLVLGRRRGCPRESGPSSDSPRGDGGQGSTREPGTTGPGGS